MERRGEILFRNLTISNVARFASPALFLVTTTLAELHADLFTRGAVTCMAWLRTRMLTTIQHLKNSKIGSEWKPTKNKSIDQLLIPCHKTFRMTTLYRGSDAWMVQICRNDTPMSPPVSNLRLVTVRRQIEGKSDLTFGHGGHGPGWQSIKHWCPQSGLSRRPQGSPQECGTHQGSNGGSTTLLQ